MTETTDYNKLISEIVKNQIDILGPDMAVRKAKSIAGLVINEKGEVESLDGDPQQILQQLVDQYIALSGAIVKNVLGPVFAKYPTIKLDLK